MTCPKCQSDDWKLASLVHKEGLTHVATTSKGVGVGIFAGGIGAGVGGAKTSGMYQTELSKLAAPPSGLDASSVFILGAFVFGLLGIFNNGQWFLLAVGCIVGVFNTWSLDMKAHETAMAEWQNVKLCQRCGTFYNPKERKRCLRCEYVRTNEDINVPVTQCPNCKSIYSEYETFLNKNKEF